MARYAKVYDNGYDEHAETSPPEIVDFLSEVIASAIPHIKNKKLPDFMPFNPRQAATWWIDQQEPADVYSERLEKVTKDGNFQAWKTPYHDRLKRTISKFLALDKPHQLYVIEAQKSGIPWRGDDFPFYITVMKEHIRMVEEGKDKYVPEAIKIIKNATIGAISK